MLFDHLPLSEPKDSPPPKVRWTLEEPWNFAGGWEPLSFRVRGGRAFEDEEDFFHNREYSDAALDRCVEAGCNHIVIPYAKGFGLESTRDEIEHEKDIVRRAHAKGLKVGLYVRCDTVIPETLVREFPDAYDWQMRGVGGRLSTYNTQQPYRRRVCFTHPGPIEYLEKVFTHAAETMDADLLHLDGFAFSNRPLQACRCAHCRDAFRRWLKAEYADDARRRHVFGIVDFDRIEIPDPWDELPPPEVLFSPDFKAWHRFLMEREFAIARHIRRFVRALSDRLAVSVNTSWWSWGHTYRHWSQVVENYMPWFDAMWAEDPIGFGYRDGHVFTRANIYKIAREYDTPVCSYHRYAEADRLECSLAYVAASNGASLSMVGTTTRSAHPLTAAFDLKKRYGQWTRANFARLGGATPAGDVAVLRQGLSLAWNARAPWMGLMAAQQSLIGMQTPWRLFDRIDADRLEQVRTAILPDMETLSDDELATLRAWVKGGGRLCFTSRSGVYDGDGRARLRHPILSWSETWDARYNRADAGGGAGGERNDGGASGLEAVREFSQGSAIPDGAEPGIESLGEGKLGFWPRFDLATDLNLMDHQIGEEDLCAPYDAAAFGRFLRTLHGVFDVQLRGPDSIVIEMERKAGTGALLVHLVQADAESGPVDVSLRISNAGAYYFNVLSPDETPPTLKRESVTLRVNGLARYAVVEATPKPARSAQ